ncbi:MAG: DUF924 family protein [Candidatus Sericytochromatia bacterium]
MSAFQEILDYWFAGLEAGDTQALTKRWFMGGAEQDAELQARFGALLAEAEAGGLQGWEHEPGSLLALVILLDQFSRNLHRGSGRAFANDVRAVGLARKALDLGWDRQFPPLQRVFFYLPFEHSEEIEDQHRSIELFESLVSEASAELRGMLAGYLDYARRHRDVVVRFGRFPHRNARLGRSSTPEEEAFLQEPGSSFG